MVVDAREPNRMHRLPPHTALGTPGALAEQDWSPEAMETDIASKSEVWGAALDLQDSFYQFSNEALGEEFGMDYPETAGSYGCVEVWTPTGFEPVAADEAVFPVFCGVPMGWSWALWAVHSIVAHETAAALGGYKQLVMEVSFIKATVGKDWQFSKPIFKCFNSWQILKEIINTINLFCKSFKLI